MSAEPNDNVVLRAGDLTLGYGSKAVLSRVSMTIRIGEFWCCLGPNGSGKSTLIKALFGLLHPLAGELWLHPELARQDRLGFVPQRCDPNPSLPITVREFVELGLVGQRVNRAERQTRMADALGKVNLSEKRMADYWSLSGGQRQRVLLARALIRRPALLVLDEPTNGLDWTSEEDLLEALAEVNRSERLTVILVTHDISMAERFASNVALFRQSSLLAGTAADMLTPDNLAATYGRHAFNKPPVRASARGDNAAHL